jgi:hypothetical protein
MLASTLLAIPFVSVFYIEMQSLSAWHERRKGVHPAPSSAPVISPKSAK